MFFCVKYLIDDELDAWLASVFAVRCPLWTTQLYSWLLAVHSLLAGRVLELANLESDSWTNVVWHGTQVLTGDFAGDYGPLSSPLPLLSLARREAVLAAAHRRVVEANYFIWLDGIKPYPYLEARLGATPSRFAEVFEIT